MGNDSFSSAQENGKPSLDGGCTQAFALGLTAILGNMNEQGALIVLPIDTFGGPLGTVPELMFEKKGLIPALQHLLVETNANP